MLVKIPGKPCDSYPVAFAGLRSRRERGDRRMLVPHPDFRGLSLQSRGIRQGHDEKRSAYRFAVLDSSGDVRERDFEAVPIADLYFGIQARAIQKPEVGIKSLRLVEAGHGGSVLFELEKCHTTVI